jgi:hypothetical protein
MQDNTTANGMTDETAQQMTAYLEELMDRQIQKLRQYDLEAAMKIAEESQQLSEQITQKAVLRSGRKYRTDWAKSAQDYEPWVNTRGRRNEATGTTLFLLFNDCIGANDE